MELSNYQLYLLQAVCDMNSDTLKHEYRKDGDTFVMEMHRLFHYGLIWTHPGNFAEGGDKPEPEDVTAPDAFLITPSGLNVIRDAITKD